MSGADATANLRAWFVRGALLAAALTLVVVVSSAFLRHWQAGLACADWPACYGRVDADPDAAPALGVRVARAAHRVAATAVLALVAGLALVAWTQSPRWRRAGTPLALALAVTLALAALGVATPGSRVPAVALGNLLGGFAILALLAVAVAAARSPAADAPSPARDAAAIAVLLVALGNAALGGSVGAHFALRQCPAPGGIGSALPALWSNLSGIDPFRALAVVGGRIASPPAAAGLCPLHAATGGVVAFVVLALAFARRRRARALAAPLAGLPVPRAGPGARALATAPSLPLTLLHNLCAALLVSALAVAAAGVRVGPAMEVPRP